MDTARRVGPEIVAGAPAGMGARASAAEERMVRGAAGHTAVGPGRRVAGTPTRRAEAPRGPGAASPAAAGTPTRRVAGTPTRRAEAPRGPRAASPAAAGTLTPRAEDPAAVDPGRRAEAPQDRGEESPLAADPDHNDSFCIPSKKVPDWASQPQSGTFLPNETLLSDPTHASRQDTCRKTGRLDDTSRACVSRPLFRG